MGQCCALDFMMTVWALLMPKVLAASLKPMPATQALFTASHVAGLITWGEHLGFLGFFAAFGDCD